MSGTLIYMVPGFFGFTSLGEVNYFYGVEEQLTEGLRKRGVEATVVPCRTRPTGSIRRRATRILEEIESSGGLEADTIHFIGHSTGGLDIRLLTTPGVRLREDDIEERIASRTRSVITVATPHYGTPIASFFTTLPGRRLLELLSVLATTRGGRYGIFGAAWVLKTIAHLDDYVGRRNTFLDTWVENLIGNINVAEDDPVWEFMREIASDQGAIIQLTPEAMNLFNAAVTDRAGVHYACVATATPTPPGDYRARDLLLSPPRLAMASLFALLHYLASREHRHYRYPNPGLDVLEEFTRDLPFEITARTNDGIAPTLSQVYGKILGVAVADHLDVVGQFATENPYRDWLPSGSGFDMTAFRQTWDRIAEEIAAAQ